jgi:hypothetical protein
LNHVQKTCSAPNRLGCHHNILDGHNGWESKGKHITKRTFLDTPKHNRQEETGYNRTKYLPCSSRRCTHQQYNKHAYLNSILIIITSHVHPTRTYNTIRITEQTLHHRLTRQHNNNNYNTYKIYYPRSCKHSSKRRKYICHHSQIRCRRSIPRPQRI